MNKILFEEQLAVFQIDAILIDNKVCSNPSPNQISEMVMLNVKHLLNGIKKFPRWKIDISTSTEDSDNIGDDFYSIDTDEVTICATFSFFFLF